MTVTVFGYVILISIDFSLVLVSIEKIYQTLKTVFDHISKHLEVRQKYSAVRRIFKSLLGVWKYSRPKLSDFYTLSQTKLSENHTLHSGTYPYSLYMGVPPPG